MLYVNIEHRVLGKMRQFEMFIGLVWYTHIERMGCVVGK